MESMATAAEILYLDFYIIGPYFWPWWSSPADLEAVVAHGLVVNGVDGNSMAESCQHGCGRIRRCLASWMA